MAQMRSFGAFVFAVAAAMYCAGMAAQAGDPATIQQKLIAQFKLTRTTADRSDIVAAGDVVVIQKPGLLMYAVSSPLPPSNAYKNGKIGQGWGGLGFLKALSVIASNKSVPMNIRTVAPTS